MKPKNCPNGFYTPILKYPRTFTIDLITLKKKNSCLVRLGILRLKTYRKWKEENIAVKILKVRTKI